MIVQIARRCDQIASQALNRIYVFDLPEIVTITDGNQHEVNIGKLLNFRKGSMVNFDKDYNGYSLV